MPRLDKEKEQLGVLKFWLGLVAVALFGIVGWLVAHYKNINDDLEMFMASSATALVLALVLVLGNKNIKRVLKEIEIL